VCVAISAVIGRRSDRGAAVFPPGTMSSDMHCARRQNTGTDCSRLILLSGITRSLLSARTGGDTRWVKAIGPSGGFCHRRCRPSPIRSDERLIGDGDGNRRARSGLATIAAVADCMWTHSFGYSAEPPLRGEAGWCRRVQAEVSAPHHTSYDHGALVSPAGPRYSPECHTPTSVGACRRRRGRRRAPWNDGGVADLP
jgi:hypothetical protein